MSLNTSGFWGSAVLEDPLDQELSFEKSLSHYNSLETARAQLEGRKPVLKKQSLKKRSAKWAATRHSQIKAELSRRKWQKVIDKMRPLVVEAGEVVQSLKAELDGAAPPEIQKKGFQAVIAWKTEKRNMLLSAQIEHERISQQWAAHQGYLRDAREASGHARHQAMELEARGKLAAAAELANEAQIDLGRLVDFQKEAEEALAAVDEP